MRFDEIQDEVLNVLQLAQGRFLTAYQICQRLQKARSPLWKTLVQEYPSQDASTPMGEGTGRHYSPASFVANALKYFVDNNMVDGLMQETFECDGVSFHEIEPGFTGNIVGIWAFQIKQVN